MNIQQISLELSKKYVEKCLNKERSFCRRKYNLEEINNIYIASYKKILKSLIEEKIFDFKINLLSYQSALIYINYLLEESEYYDIDIYILEFIKAYKYTSKEIKKHFLLIELLESSKQKSIGYTRKK